jgi:anti-sigma regulatory factor (Ser/Thr protein kinase)
MVRRQQEYDGDLRQLAAMRAFLREICQEGWQGEPVDQSLVLRLELALTEAASNIILHGFQNQPHKSITMTVELKADQVAVTLRHPGEPFDPQAAPAPSFDGSREGGFGLYLIRKCVDDVQYRQDDPGWCVMHLVNKRKQRPTGEDHAANG